MKKIMAVTMAGLAMGVMSASATLILDANNTEWALSGTMTVINGDKAGFVNSPGGTPDKIRWELPTVNNGTSRTATTVANTTIGSSTDYYFNYGGTDYSSIPALSVTGNRYVEVSYSLSGNWVGGETSHDIRLQTSNEAQAFDTPTGRDKIAAADGTHTFIIDLTEGGTTWTGDWIFFRWDMFNGNDNTGQKTFTINSITYGNSVTAVPEPATLGLVTAVGGGILFIRRRFMI